MLVQIISWQLLLVVLFRFLKAGMSCLYVSIKFIFLYLPPVSIFVTFRLYWVLRHFNIIYVFFPAFNICALCATDFLLGMWQRN